MKRTHFTLTKGTLGEQVVLVAILSLTLTQVTAQSGPCRDLDGDGYLAGAGCAVQEDCNDLNPTIHPLSPELCNGFDDDCDGDLDEGCARICADYEMSNRVMIIEIASKGRIATADRSWAIMYSDSETYFPYYLTRYDFRGEPLAPARLYSGGEDVPEEETSGNELAWDGARMVIGWAVQDLPHGVSFREAGPWGRSENSSLQLSTSGGGYFGTGPLIWNGYEYALFYAQTGGNFSMNRITAESEDLGDNLLLSLEGSDTTWNGSGFSVLFRDTSSITNFSELYFRKVTPDGLLDDSEIQLTDHTGLLNAPLGVSPTLRIVKSNPGQGYGITWSDYKTGRWNIFFARLDEAGNLMMPPGEIQISRAVDWTTDVARDQDLIWNGEEFMLAWTENAFGPCGDIYLTRISVTGTILEDKIVIPGFCNVSPRIAWNGREYGIIFSQNDEYPAGGNDVELATIGCNCATDGDSDGVLPCAGGDCDDSDPEVGAGMSEICTDGKDNDCDNLVDCNDPDCGQGGNPPAEITGVGFDDKVTLAWVADGKADDYDIARGTLSDLRAMENYLWADCLGSRINGMVVTDTETPLVGVGWYYQVRGHARTCLVGTWGDNLRDDTIRICP